MGSSTPGIKVPQGYALINDPDVVVKFFWPLHTAHILLVDDEEPITTLSTLILERHGFTVGAYNDTAGALEAVSQNTKKYDVAILDYTMPEMTGLEMARALNSLQPKMSVILATGLLDKTNLEQETPENVKDIIKKPFDADVLLAVINAALFLDGP